MVTTKDVPIVIAIIALRKIFKHMLVLTQLTGLAKRQNSFDVCVLQLLFLPPILFAPEILFKNI